MAKKSSKRRQWTRDDVRELKASARQKTPARKIARALKRTEGATRQKAFSLRISFSRKPVYLAVKREGRLLRDMLDAGRPAVRTAALSASWYPLWGADWGSSGLLSCSRPSLRCWWRDRRCARCS